ncbi:MAG: hypothetical protein A3B96_01725 [Candidatus Spechtbacteria bacterium RIFCSPHIGHO2_02_FULL_43_15b]|uniref:Transport permease protein n=1 Tax=Candidatus Spechtbacteria bacterium RIFCSPHIGHO2_01_FULL_43_30 TaxID=1802158 RepID=A0A1G2H604_9BACT|nr:MAG: hypothetical protein A2827_01705 [Candidatus Spechtbacteria bacterium RIFCSPHIGHO2_01_FULL_43_30]OGZ60294.1 MAG: hypothetical protein A3B96_01725 [Candidatus Spechtbacteria bacterium RIFCSPHIGHO2_02_FULL_43_15b]
MNYLHIKGIVLRNFFLTRKSPHRVAGLFYLITLELVAWGFVTFWIQDIAETDLKVNFVLTLLGALIFWHMFYEGQQGISVAFLEDIWARNVINVFSSPVKLSEFVVALSIVSVINAIIGTLFISCLAFIFYGLEIWSFGFYIVPLFVNVLVFGWALGFVSMGLILRFGPSFEVLVWSIPAIFMPLSAVFYPVSVLPEFFAKVAYFLPTMHVFEGMRSVILNSSFPMENIVMATLLNIFYFILSIFILYLLVRSARNKGALSRLVVE